jgi:hypothetical protein
MSAGSTNGEELASASRGGRREEMKLIVLLAIVFIASRLSAFNKRRFWPYWVKDLAKWVFAKRKGADNASVSS